MRHGLPKHTGRPTHYRSEDIRISVIIFDMRPSPLSRRAVLIAMNCTQR